MLQEGDDVIGDGNWTLVLHLVWRSIVWPIRLENCNHFFWIAGNGNLNKVSQTVAELIIRLTEPILSSTWLIANVLRFGGSSGSTMSCSPSNDGSLSRCQISAQNSPRCSYKPRINFNNDLISGLDDLGCCAHRCPGDDRSVRLDGCSLHNRN